MLPNARLQVLLVVLIVAAVARLVIIPWFDWQRDQINSLKTVSMRLDRSIKLGVEKEQIERHHAVAVAKLAALKERFPAPESVGRFRIDAQQSINQDALKAGATLRLFDWVDAGSLPMSNLQYQVARMEFFGTLSAVSKAQALVESSRPYLLVREVRFVGEVPANATDDTAVGLVITAEFFYVSSNP